MPFDPTRPFLISPPFGGFLSHANAYSVLGSYTVHPISGWIGKGIRPVYLEKGAAWIYPQHRPNHGLDRLVTVRSRTRRQVVTPLPPFKPNQIISFALHKSTDWQSFLDWVEATCGRVTQIEFYIHHPSALKPSRQIRERLLAVCPDAIFKFPPTNASIDAAFELYDAGFRYFSLSGSLYTPAGMLSGTPLREICLPLVEELVTTALADAVIIAGGGIRSPDDVARYRSAGATMFSLCSVFFRPGRGRKILNNKS